MFNRAEHVLVDSLGNTWINMDELLLVIAQFNAAVQEQPYANTTAPVGSITAQITTELRLALMRL